MSAPIFRTVGTACVLALTASVALTGCGDATEAPRPEAASSCAPCASPPTAPATAAAAAATAAEPEPSAAAEPAAEPRDQRAAPPEPEPVDGAELRVKRLVIARGVEAREPVDAGTTFALAKGKRLYAFVEVSNLDQVESEVFVTFEPEKGPARGHVRLRVGAAPRWRTWAFTRGVREPGKWAAVVRDGSGTVLGRSTFEVTDPAAPPPATPAPPETPEAASPPPAAQASAPPPAAEPPTTAQRSGPTPVAPAADG